MKKFFKRILSIPGIEDLFGLIASLFCSGHFAWECGPYLEQSGSFSEEAVAFGSFAFCFGLAFASFCSFFGKFLDAMRKKRKSNAE